MGQRFTSKYRQYCGMTYDEHTKRTSPEIWPDTYRDKSEIPVDQQLAQMCNAVVNDRPDLADHCEFSLFAAHSILHYVLMHMRHILISLVVITVPDRLDPCPSGGHKERGLSKRELNVDIEELAFYLESGLNSRSESNSLSCVLFCSLCRSCVLLACG